MAERVVAGNWKMHLGLREARELFTSIMDDPEPFPEGVRVIVAPPFPFIHSLYRELPPDSAIELGGQDCHAEPEGAFTGEVSAPMLSSIGAKYCIVGHSERRRDFGESDELVRQKASRLLQHGIRPIICVGESLEEREAGRHKERVGEQSKGSFLTLSPEEAQQCVLAYEPVWAIGTGHTASPEQAQEMHAHIRETVGNKGLDADRIPIIYGGSCKAGNAAELFSQKDIDGGLIGGASLKAGDFCSIVRAAG